MHSLIKSQMRRRKIDLSIARLEISNGTSLSTLEVCISFTQSSVFHCIFLFSLWVKFDNGVDFCFVDFDSA